MTQVYLNGLIDKDIVVTDATRKLTIKGVTSNYKVYRIPLEYLHYNDKNGRIISWISKYEADGNVLELSNKEIYNEILQGFIEESNRAALDETRKNIARFGQRLPGVVLNDGRVIDGNRRFTCLRQLKAEGQDVYFEAVILDPDQGLSAKDIKRLELNLQHAEERPVDYNPIDNLVDVYRDVELNKFFTIAEYAENTNKKPKEVEKMLKKANLMVDFLDFINASGKFYVARDLELDGPLQEALTILNKEDAKDQSEYLRVRNALFTALAIPNRGDLTRYIRSIGKDILNADNREGFLNDYEDIVEEVYETFHEQEDVNVSVVREVNTELEIIKTKAGTIIDTKIEETGLTRVRSKPVESLKLAFTALEGIDTDQISRLDTENKNEFKSILEKIESTMKLYSEKLGV